MSTLYEVVKLEDITIHVGPPDLDADLMYKIRFDHNNKKEGPKVFKAIRTQKVMIPEWKELGKEDAKLILLALDSNRNGQSTPNQIRVRRHLPLFDAFVGELRIGIENDGILETVESIFKK